MLFQWYEYQRHAQRADGPSVLGDVALNDTRQHEEACLQQEQEKRPWLKTLRRGASLLASTSIANVWEHVPLGAPSNRQHQGRMKSFLRSRRLTAP